MMLDLIKEILDELTIISSANSMMEMANWFPTKTGIPYAIWYGRVGGQHGPRIKVSNIKGKMSPDCFVISVSKTPTVLTPKSCKLAQSEVADILDWVMLNYDTLMQLWQVYETGTGFSAPLLQQLQKI